MMSILHDRTYSRAAILRLIVRNEFNEIQEKIVGYVAEIIRDWIDGSDSDSVETRMKRNVR